VVKDFNKARTLKNDRVIFEINGNDYRLIAEVNYPKGWVFIKFVGTHAEYDKVDAETVNLYKKKNKK
jgi:mRNA interferase HigB